MRRRVFIAAVDSRLAKAVAYARVSSKEQEREGYSIQAQETLVRDYAAGRGMAVVKEFVDVETAKQARRAQFGLMIDYLKSHRDARSVLVEKTNRLHRNLKDWVTINEIGIGIHFVKANRGSAEEVGANSAKRPDWWARQDSNLTRNL